MKIKDLSKDEMGLFSGPFIQSPTLNLVRNDEAWKVLTSSEDFRGKVIRVDCASGAIVVEYGIKRGIILYRYDHRDEAKGTPINVDVYALDGSELAKIQPPFPGHWLAFLPE